MASMALTAQAATLTWDNGGADDSLSTAGNWNPDQAPTSSDDLVIGLTGSSNTDLNSAYTVADGRSFSGTAGTGNLVFRMEDGGHLTVADGGTLDFTLGSGSGISVFTERGTTAASSGRKVTLEDGATFKVDRFLTHNDWTTEFVASATGVATMEVTDLLRFRNSDTLLVDLNSYVNDIERTLILFDYASLIDEAATFTVLGYTSEQYTLNYAYDQGEGDLAVALTIVPEPGTFALLGGLLALSYVMVRRRA